MDKQALARPLRDLRLAYDDRIRAVWDETIKNEVIKLIDDKHCIGIYVSFNHEVDTLNIIKALLGHKRVCVPRIVDRVMHFVEIRSLADLKAQTMGILEPVAKDWINPKEIDAFLIPLSAFNERGYRIGYGKGYYDRYLKGLFALKIGLAYSFQKLDLAFESPHDVACDIIVTERGNYEKQ